MSSTVACFLLFLAVFFASCRPTKNIAYFPTLRDSVITKEAEDLEPVIAKNDLLNITVYTPDPEASANINRAAVGTSVSPSGGASEAGYLVSRDGFIQFPFLGTVKAAGLTKRDLANYLTQQLLSRKFVLDPIVSIRQANFRVTVLGEVSRPSVIPVPSEQITILEAIGMAGDVTLYGKRENVLLIRQENGKKTSKRLDLRSNDLLTSPYYYLRPNDVVYVEPNEARMKAAEGRQPVLPIILSGISVLVVLVDRIFR